MRERNRVLEREQEPDFRLKREEEQLKIASETGIPVCTNRKSGCDQNLETRNRISGFH